MTDRAAHIGSLCGLALVGLLLFSHCTSDRVIIAMTDGGPCIGAGCTCAPGLINCGGVCVNPSNDPANCGGCGLGCGPLGQCLSGNCQCPAGAGELCDAECTDTRVDPNHCGGCEAPCEIGERCAAGGCLCQPDLTDCGSGCVDTNIDAEHCGGCNNPCSAPDEWCYQGNCTATPCDMQVPPATECNPNSRSCVPAAVLDSHPLHCGSCGEQCDADQLCSEGNCREYHAATGCTVCPCPTCAPEDLCCPYPGIGDPVCLSNATVCP